MPSLFHLKLNLSFYTVILSRLSYCSWPERLDIQWKAVKKRLSFMGSKDAGMPSSMGS
jgi:hypothetical protein